MRDLCVEFLKSIIAEIYSQMRREMGKGVQDRERARINKEGGGKVGKGREVRGKCRAWKGY